MPSTIQETLRTSGDQMHQHEQWFEICGNFLKKLGLVWELAWWNKPTTTTVPQNGIFSKTASLPSWKLSVQLQGISLGYVRRLFGYSPFDSILKPFLSSLRLFDKRTHMDSKRFHCALQTASLSKSNDAKCEALGREGKGIADWLCTFATQVLHKLQESVSLALPRVHIQIAPEMHQLCKVCWTRN